MLGGIQPEKLVEMLLQTTDDGLVPRFLWVWPDAIKYQRPQKVAEARRLDGIYRRLDGLRFGVDGFGNDCPIALSLHPKAADGFEAWVQDSAPSIQEAAGFYRGFLGKAKGVALRLALASELFNWADDPTRDEPTVISPRSVAAAIGFIEDYAKPTARRVFGDAALPLIERQGAALARKIVSKQARTVNRREIQRGWKIPGCTTAEDIGRALEFLAEADWLRPLGGRAGDNPGKQRGDFAVNPKVFGGGQ